MGAYRSVALLLVNIVGIALIHGAAAPTRREYLSLLNALQQRAEDPYIQARCDLQTNPGLPDDVRAANSIQGTVTFKQLKTGGSMNVSVQLTGLDTSSATLHGFHVHQFGDLSNGCASTGGHFNPFGKQHGGPSDTQRHVGDFGNVERDSVGSVNEEFSDEVASLVGADTIIGRAIVLHKDTDDLGRGDYDDSLTTGHAGARLACCIIEQV
ncbi:superoxide dismutase [Cu-Zn]-like [Acanthaster planci]|uniref:Superoxide dismutase [Cu-Zn] n=1 Tax=Acanthaster planci TaxID=133434 RepID=A0A8B7XIP6_ACAPL|nr:superoxide dismutase [Cu-Zn]-like [Acanthaster planci]